MTDLNQYAEMQRDYYNSEAQKWSPENREPVVGHFEMHSAWSGYENLFRELTGEQMKEMVALDFGCGPARNIVKYHGRFKQIDGVDISTECLEKAKVWKERHNIHEGNLYLCNGIDLRDIPDNTYDIVFSTICMQHIAVHSTRMSLMKEFHRVLKKGGIMSIQMGFGNAHYNHVDYFSNDTSIGQTNGGCDVEITDIEPLQKDVESIGFTQFSHVLDGSLPDGKIHDYWMFFRGIK